MLLSQSDLALIVERSANLAERLQAQFTPKDVNESVRARRLIRWKEFSAGNDPKTFASQLKAYGMSHAADEEIRARLGPVSHQPDGPLPKWASFLGQITNAVSQSAYKAHHDDDRICPPQRKAFGIPYEDLYWPIIEFAWGIVESAHPVVATWPGHRARHGIQKYLLRRLSTIFSVTLHTAFLARKSFGSFGMMQHLFASVRADSARSALPSYRSFVIEQGQDGLRSLFMRYPVAARLIAEVTMFWIDFVQEFLRRLERDRNDLDTQFNNSSLVGPPLAIKAGVSDPHREGRSVLILSFRRGLRLVYKPRPLEVDRQFFALLGELNARMPEPGLRILKVMDRGGYGWMEFAHRGCCRNRNAAARYYHRAGSLVCLVHWLQGIDFHRENVVASGEHPVLIDLEALAHPPRPEERATNAHQLAFGSFANSVLRTGLLPLRQSKYLASAHYDLSGFGAPVRAGAVVSSHRWQHVNTDRMELTMAKRRRFHDQHRAKLNNRLLSIRSYERDVLRGYRELANLLGGDHRHDLARWRSLIVHTCRRRIKRPTLIYSVLLQTSLEPRYLMDGVDRSIELMALPCFTGDEKEWLHELESLEKLDVPYFHFAAEDDPAMSQSISPSVFPDLLDQVNAVKLALRHGLCLKAGIISKRSGR